MKIFLGEPSPYLPEFLNKPRKAPNGYIDNPGRVLNLALPVNRFSGKNNSDTGGDLIVMELTFAFDIFTNVYPSEYDTKSINSFLTWRHKRI